MGFMDIDDALNDPGFKAVRLKDNEFIFPVATPACWHNPLRDKSDVSAGVAEEINAEWNLPPTTMIGTRRGVTLTFSLINRAKREAEYVAGLSFWRKLYYRGFLRQQAD